MNYNMTNNSITSLAKNGGEALEHVAVKPKLPGDPGIWMIVTLDSFVFCVYFFIFTVERMNNLALFEQGQLQLNTVLGFANTLVLLTSSLFVVKAVKAARERIPDKVKVNLLLAILCGVAFGVLKVVGYTLDIQDGHSLTTNLFFGYYFAITGIHFVHVLIGLVALIVCFNKARRNPMDDKYLVWIESGATFWHFVDMLWVIIFPMFYLLRAV